MNTTIPEMRKLRRRVFRPEWPLDDDLTATASEAESHRFLGNPAAQLPYIYLTQYVAAFAEMWFGTRFGALHLLDWGCGKGHVSKLMQEMHPERLISCDVRTSRGDSAFGQEAPLLARFGISVVPLVHESTLPFADNSFEIVLSFGVLEHVPSDRASMAEIARVLKAKGLFFCFHLPTRLSWTQFVARRGGDNYHDRLYTAGSVGKLLAENGLGLLDMWYRGILPKNRIHYPMFRLFERVDQVATEYTPLRYFATNLEFVCAKGT